MFNSTQPREHIHPMHFVVIGFALGMMVGMILF